MRPSPAATTPFSTPVIEALLSAVRRHHSVGSPPQKQQRSPRSPQPPPASPGAAADAPLPELSRELEWELSCATRRLRLQRGPRASSSFGGGQAEAADLGRDGGVPLSNGLQAATLCAYWRWQRWAGALHCWCE